MIYMNRQNSIMRLLFAILLLLGFGGTLSAQIYPVQTDLRKEGLKGPVQATVTVTRTYSPAAERWEPLQVKVVSTFNEKGQIQRRRTFLQHTPSTTSLFTYDKESDSLQPVLELTAGEGTGGDSARLILDESFIYRADGKIEIEVERNLQSGKTTRHQYTYAGSNPTHRVEYDSATGAITAVEEFFYMAGNKPRGSTIRRFDPSTDPVRSLKDTAAVPDERIAYDYTSYVYGDTTTPVIFWKWEYGRDTVVDRQEVQRFLEDGTLMATIVQTFKNRKIVHSRSQLFNEYGDPVSSADSFGNDTTYQRAFDYIYDESDARGNWTDKRQYTAATPGSTTSDERLLLYRTDRTILYREE